MITTEIKKRLNEAAFHNTIETLISYGNEPEEEIKEALREIPHTLTQIACGEAENCYYVCPIDPGLGKTTSLIEWMKVFSFTQEFSEVGVVVCFDRYEQIENFINESGLRNYQFAVWVNEANDTLGLNKRGTKDIDRGQILLTTKRQIVLRGLGRPFAENKEFFFKGKPRTVRIWDETLMAGSGLTLTQANLGTLEDVLSNVDTKQLYHYVKQIRTQLDEVVTGQTYQVPNLPVAMFTFMKHFEDRPEETKRKAEKLCLLSGKLVSVRTSSKGKIMVDCMEDMPSDFTPCLVTDASARVRETYRLHADHRKNLIYLPNAAKQYEPLTCYLWDTSSGKKALFEKENLTVVAKEIARLIDDYTSEEFLIVRFKPGSRGRGDIVEAVMEFMKTKKDRVKTLHYGIHTATNSFAHIPNIILAGALFYEMAEYEAIARAAMNRPTSSGDIDPHIPNAVRLGEIKHHILQAACRGRIRGCIGNACPETKLWIIGHKKTGINDDMLHEIFPGCKVDEWITAEINLTLKQEQVLKILKDRTKKGEKVIPLSEILQTVGIRDNSTFNRDIMKGGFLEALKELGLKKKGSRTKACFIKN